MTAACPYCGHPARLAPMQLWSTARREHCRAAECSNPGCEAVGPLRSTPEAALDAWNHRPPPKPLTPTERQQTRLF